MINFLSFIRRYLRYCVVLVLMVGLIQFGDRRAVGKSDGVNDANNPNLQVDAQAGYKVRSTTVPVQVLADERTYGVFVSLLSRSIDARNSQLGPCAVTISLRSSLGFTQEVGKIVPQFNDQFSHYKFVVLPDGDYTVLELTKPEECLEPVLSLRGAYTFPLSDTSDTGPAREGSLSYTAITGQVEPGDYKVVGAAAISHSFTRSEPTVLGAVTVNAKIIGSGGKGEYSIKLYELNEGDDALVSQTSFTAAEAAGYYRVATDSYTVPLPAKIRANKDYMVVLDSSRVKQNRTNRILVAQQAGATSGVVTVDGKDLPVMLNAFTPQLFSPVLEQVVGISKPVRLYSFPTGANSSRVEFSLSGGYQDCINAIASGSDSICFNGGLRQRADSDGYITFVLPITGTINNGHITVLPGRIGDRLRDLEVEYSLDGARWSPVRLIRTRDQVSYVVKLDGEYTTGLSVRVRATAAERQVVERGEGKYIGLSNVSVQLSLKGGSQ